MKKTFILSLILSLTFKFSSSQNCISKDRTLNVSSRQKVYIYTFDSENPKEGVNTTTINFGFELRKYNSEKVKQKFKCNDYFKFTPFSKSGLEFAGEEAFFIDNYIYVYSLDNIFVSKEGYYTTYVTSNILDNYLIREETHIEDGIEFDDYYYAIPLKKVTNNSQKSEQLTISPFWRDVLKDIIVNVASDFIKKKIIK